MHYFPEGKIRQDGRVHPFRRGVGRLAACVAAADELLVIPFYHAGTEIIQPTSRHSSSIFSWPKLNVEVHVLPGGSWFDFIF